MAGQVWRGAHVTSLPGWFKIGDLFNPGVTEWCCLDRMAGGARAEYLYRLQRADKSLQVKIVRRSRKTLALQVDRCHVAELRVPLKCSWSEIRDFLNDKFDWAIAATEELSMRPLRPADEFLAGGQIWFLGRPLTLVVRKSRYGMVDRTGDELYVSCQDPANKEAIEKQVMNWFRRQAGLIFNERLLYLNRLFADDCHPSGIKIRKMKSQWGNCSSKGEISLNLLLIRESLPQIDFVIAHELCHLRHFAHNEAFYELLDEVMPGWETQEAALGGVD